MLTTNRKTEAAITNQGLKQTKRAPIKQLCFPVCDERNVPDTHGECVDVFVQLIQQSNGLDDHVVDPVDIELHFSSGVAVAKTQLSLGGSLAGQTLHQGVEVQTHA